MKYLISIFFILFFAISAKADCDLTPKFSYKTKSLSVDFDNRSIGDFSSVKWTFGDGNTSTDISPEHIYEEEGMYVFSLTIYNNEGCSETFEGKVYVFNLETVRPAEKENNTISRPIEEIEEEQITNYPNPFNEVTTVAFDLAEDDKVKVNVHDISGRLVAILANENMRAGRKELLFERKNLLPGTYLVTAQTSKGILTRKITIH
ncbi:MAG: PKD domain-containing protein [Chitinophagales bacterium]